MRRSFFFWSGEIPSNSASISKSLFRRRIASADFDASGVWTSFGRASTKARKAEGMTKEQLARIVDYDPRHLQAVENEGQYPGMELFIQLITMFDISVDEYIHTGSKAKKIATCQSSDDFHSDILLSADEPIVILPAIHHIIRIDCIIYDLENYHIAFLKQDKSVSIFRDIFP